MEPCPCCGQFQPYVPRLANALQTTANDYSRADGFCIIVENWKPRRLTPTECERLQGFPDGYTSIYAKRKTPDACRYKALGNSMPVPVMAWIGKRIQMVEGLK